MFFECLKESVLPESLGDVLDAQDIIIKEKGQQTYNDLVEDRREREEQRRIREQSIRNPESLFLKAQFNTEEEKKRAQERAQQR